MKALLGSMLMTLIGFPISTSSGPDDFLPPKESWPRSSDPDTLRTMKPPYFFLTALSVGLLLSACEKRPSTSESPTAEPKPAVSTPAASATAEVSAKVDADTLLRAFGSAGAEEQSRVGKAAQAIRSENYGAALEILEHLLAQGHLTPEQKVLVTAFVSQLQKLKP